LHNIDTLYVADAYHIADDKKQKDALAAKGYYDAFQKVKALLKEAHEEGKDNLDLNYRLL